VLAELVKEDLWRLIDKIYPANSIPDALSCERHRHAAYGATRQRIYVGGEKYFKVLDSTMRDRKFKPVIITGQSGAGKSALLANWAARWSKRHPQDAVITHYLGSGVDSAEPVKFVTRCLSERSIRLNSWNNYPSGWPAAVHGP
jgi:nephrocystin-3